MDITGTGGDDTLIGTPAADTINALAGDDVIVANAGNDEIDAGEGNDTVYGGDGNDFIRLDDGGDDTAYGEAGDDAFLFGGAFTFADLIDGGAGNDQIGLQGDYSAGVSLGRVSGVEGLILLTRTDGRFGPLPTGLVGYTITAEDSTVAAGARLQVDASQLQASENMIFDGSRETDGSFFMYGGLGVDRYIGGANDDVFLFRNTGFRASDRIDGGGGAIDQIGLQGNYTGANALVMEANTIANIDGIVLLSGTDSRFAGANGLLNRYDLTTHDGNLGAGRLMTIDGGSLLTGETLAFDGSRETDGTFRIFGGQGDDVLTGGAGNDTIRASGGNDRLQGGGGADQLTGGAGADVFVMTGGSIDGATNVASILDFSSADDSIVLSGDAFVGLANGLLDEQAFRSGGAVDADDRILYDAATGTLSYDYDGSGIGAALVFARLAPGTALSAADFSVADVPAGLPGPTPIVDEVELNNSLGTANLIDRNAFRIDSGNFDLPDNGLPSGTVRASLSSGTDLDFFTFTVEAGELVVLDIDGGTGGLDTLIRVYGPDRVEFGDNDDADVVDPGSEALPNSTRTLDSFAQFRAPVSGTYTVSVGAFESSSAGTYRLNISIGPVATSAQLQEEDIQALMSGARWNAATLTYGFPQAAAQIPASYHRGETTNNFEGFNSVQRAVVARVLDDVASTTNLAFVEDVVDPGTANLRFAMSDAANSAYAYLPTGSLLGGSSWYRNTGGRFDNPVRGDYAYMTILHETGHALGLKHGHELPALSPGHDSMEFTVMTYRSYVGDPLNDGGYRNERFGYAQTFMMFDIAALQRMYGADFTFNGSDTIYSWNPATGQTSINGVGQSTPGENRILMTIWDGGGVDTYDLSNYVNTTIIDLRPGEFTTTSAVQLANLGLGNYARGNVANALLFQDDTRSLIENAIGGFGDDTIIANRAANRLTGNGGGDGFRWHAAADTGVGAADTVVDFQSGVDRIDLSRIDADTRTAGDDSFRFIGTGAFTRSAGELRYENQGGSAHIFGDIDGDGIADFEIVLENVPVPVATDFFL